MFQGIHININLMEYKNNENIPHYMLPKIFENSNSTKVILICNEFVTFAISISIRLTNMYRVPNKQKK